MVLFEFFGAMHQKLGENVYKGGWRDETVDWLIIRMKEEILELENAIASNSHPDAVRLEAADVANFAMMAADSYKVNHAWKYKCQGAELCQEPKK